MTPVRDQATRRQGNQIHSSSLLKVRASPLLRSTFLEDWARLTRMG